MDPDEDAIESPVAVQRQREAQERAGRRAPSPGLPLSPGQRARANANANANAAAAAPAPPPPTFRRDSTGSTHTHAPPTGGSGSDPKMSLFLNLLHEQNAGFGSPVMAGGGVARSPPPAPGAGAGACAAAGRPASAAALASSAGGGGGSGSGGGLASSLGNGGPRVGSLRRGGGSVPYVGIKGTAASAARAPPPVPSAVAAATGAFPPPGKFGAASSASAAAAAATAAAAAAAAAAGAAAAQASAAPCPSLASPPAGLARKIRIGVCAMDKKARSAPMREIVARLLRGGEFEIVTFGDDAILNEPVDQWPVVECLLAWHSDGFPLDKALRYADLRHPFLVNDLRAQLALRDRRSVYRSLVAAGVPVPHHIVVSRDGWPHHHHHPSQQPQRQQGQEQEQQLQAVKEQDGDEEAKTRRANGGGVNGGSCDSCAAEDDADADADADADGADADDASTPLALPDPPGFVEADDWVELDGVRVHKPFVEKPASGEDHRVSVYYPSSMGGGVKRLFRKRGDKSSEYDPRDPGRVRRDGSYIYEEFVTTGGTDVKVYTVGPRYAHAEARKSPVVDGRVLRAPDGKEVRFPVLLSPQEKEIARVVSLTFKQKVCGFDLLRSEGRGGRALVCDVNGWSFVKGSPRYYDDAAGILRTVVLQALAPHRLAALPSLPPLLPQAAAAAAAAAQDQAQGGSELGAAEAGAGALLDGAEGESGPRGRDAGFLALLHQAPPVVPREPSFPASSVHKSAALAAAAAAEAGAAAAAASPILSGDDLAAGLAELSAADAAEARRTDERSEREELRCVLAVVRHGDRTPKQKLKMRLAAPACAPLLRLFERHCDARRRQAKLKTPGQLQEMLDATRELLEGLDARQQARRAAAAALAREASGGAAAAAESAAGAAAAALPSPPAPPAADAEEEEMREKLRIVRTVLEQGGHFSGVNRKVQLKPVRFAAAAAAPAAADGEGDATGAGAGADANGGGRNNNKPPAPLPQLEEALLVLKYGGVLTHAGRTQAESLGRLFRLTMYPGGEGAGGGLLRLHSTYRHDLKLYSSDEGRVQSSAAAFTKGLLDLEGASLTPILVSLVQKDASMLEAFGKGASDEMRAIKAALYAAVLGGGGGGGSDAAAAATAAATAGEEAAAAVVSPPAALRPEDVPFLPRDPVLHLHRVADLMREVVDELRALCVQESRRTSTSASAAPAAGGGGGGGAPAPPAAAAARYSSVAMDPRDWRLVEGQPCGGERLLLMFDRWSKLLRSFRSSDKHPSSASAAAAAAAAAASAASASAAAAAPVDSTPPPTPVTFDISKVPDIYDSAKYDAIHNAHLCLGAPLDALYREAKVLADAVAPNEYGATPLQRLDVGGRIAHELLGKLIADLESMREESLATLTAEEAAEVAGARAAGGAAGLAGATPPASPGQRRPPGAWLGGGGGGGAGGAGGAVGGGGGGGPGGASPGTASLAGGSDGALDDGPPFMGAAAHWTAALGGGASGGGGGEGDASAGGGGAAAAGTASASGRRRVRLQQQQQLQPHGDHAAGDEASAQEDDEAPYGAEAGDYDDDFDFDDDDDDEDDDDDDGKDGDERQARRAARAGARARGSFVSPGDFGHHRLCPTYAPDVNSPLRHVRTRVYFTSESHMHALVNLLRYCHLRPADDDKGGGGDKGDGERADGDQGGGDEGDGGGGGGSAAVPPPPPCPRPLLTPEAEALLAHTAELDYLTHVVLRLYELKDVPASDAGRFRVEVLFSPGAAFDPTRVSPAHGDHVLPAMPRVRLCHGEGVPLDELETRLRPFAARKFQPAAPTTYLESAAEAKRSAALKAAAKAAAV